MADQNITELPVKTSSGITSSDYMLGIDSAEGYQMLIRDLGDYIIRNVQVNTIAGANQTLKSALDTLNSNTVKGQTSQLPNITTLSDLNSLSAGVHDRYITGISGIAAGWYGIIVSTTNNVDAIPTQILYGTNGTYVRHSDDKITWSNAKLAKESEFCRVQVIKGNTSFVASEVGSSGYDNPYGILIIAYGDLYIVSSSNTNDPLSVLRRITTQTPASSGLTLTDGVLRFGTDANRQYLCIMPPNVQLVPAT